MLNNLIAIIKHQKQKSSLKYRVGVGSLILGFGSVIENGGRFIKNVILTRILVPDDFGTMAVVIAINSMYEFFTDVGIKEAVIQNQRGSEQTFLNGAWWFSFIRSTGLYIISFISAPLIASFYNNNTLVSLIRLSFINILLNGSLSAGLFLALKNMDYKKWVYIRFGGNILGITVGICLALILKNVWALAFGFCAEAFFRCILSYLYCPFLPKIKFHKGDIKSLLKFSKGMFGLPFLTYVSMKSDIFVLGKLYSSAELGLYNMTSNLAQMPTFLISNIIGQTLVPAFSNIQNDNKKLTESFLNIVSFTMQISFPLIMFSFYFGKELVSLVYGTSYAAYSIPFSFIFTAYLVRTSQIPLDSICFAKGHPSLIRFTALIRALITVVLMYPISKVFGFNGVSVLILIIWIVPLFIQIQQTKKIINIEFKKLQFSTKCTVLSLIPFAFVASLFKMYNGHISNFNSIVVGLFCCLISYVILFLLNKANLREIIKLQRF